MKKMITPYAWLLLSICLIANVKAAPVPVGLWLADGNALDTIGSNNGTLTGTTTFAAGKHGQAFSFDGNGLVKLPDNTFDYLASGNISISAWMKTNLGNVPGPAGGDVTSVMFNRSWMLYFDFAEVGVPAPLWNGSFTNRLSSGIDIRDNQWHNVTSVFNSGTANVYIDGILKATGTRTLGSGDVSVNDNQFGGGYFSNYIGLLDEVAIYDTALSQADVTAITNGSLTAVPVPAAIWLFGSGLIGLLGMRRNKQRT